MINDAQCFSQGNKDEFIFIFRCVSKVPGLIRPRKVKRICHNILHTVLYTMSLGTSASHPAHHMPSRSIKPSM